LATETTIPNTINNLAVVLRDFMENPAIQVSRVVWCLQAVRGIEVTISFVICGTRCQQFQHFLRIRNSLTEGTCFPWITLEHVQGLHMGMFDRWRRSVHNFNNSVMFGNGIICLVLASVLDRMMPFIIDQL
jgi:hypothetical protein